MYCGWGCMCSRCEAEADMEREYKKAMEKEYESAIAEQWEKYVREEQKDALLERPDGETRDE